MRRSVTALSGATLEVRPGELVGLLARDSGSVEQPGRLGPCPPSDGPLTEPPRTPLMLVLLVAGALLVGLIFAALGTLAGALLDELGATSLMLFVAMTDPGIAQSPTFGSGSPGGWAVLLPGYGPGRMMVDGGFSSSFHAAGALAIVLGWVVALTATVGLVPRRAVGTRG